jgi:orotate phosphoribosyltransferase
MSVASSVAKTLLQEKAVFLSPHEPFTWTSGIKSPVYCDNRLLISAVPARERIVEAFVAAIRPLNVDVVAGTATAGIPWAAWVAHELKLPLVYVRASSKDHGRKNAVEGAVTSGQTAVLIEDLVSTGKSSIAAGEKLRKAGVAVPVIMSIFTYDFPQAREVFREAGFEAASLSSFAVLAQVAYEEKLLDAAALSEILAWRERVRFP